MTDAKTFDEKHYVPILKWKRGEATALKELAPRVKSACTPVIEIAPIPFDYEKSIDKKTTREHFEAAAEMLKTNWGAAPAFVDLRLLPAKLANGKALTLMMELMRKAGAHAIPVVSTTSPPDVLAAAAGAHASDGYGVCVRDRIDDVLSPAYPASIASTLLALGTTHRGVDLILDLQDVSITKLSVMLSATQGAIMKIPSPLAWRTLTLASTAFPVNLSGLVPGVHSIPRSDWMLWSKLPSLPRVPTYGDYAVSHWDVQELDPRVIKISASIRYTTDTEWIIFRGRNVKAHGFGQYSTFSKQLMKHAAYCGASFSAGDDYIAKCAAGGGTGNHETWRRVATNHHITFAARQLAKRSASSAPGGPGTATGSV